MESSTNTSLSFPARPQTSKTFKAKTIDLFSNHFKISNFVAQPLIYQYAYQIYRVFENDLKQLIPADDRIQAASVFRAANKDIVKYYGKKHFRSGGAFYSHNSEEEAKTIEVTNDNNIYRITLVKVKSLDISNEILKDSKDAIPILQFINIGLKEFFRKKGYHEWGRNLRFYDPEFIDIAQHKLRIHLGWKTSCGIYQNCTPRILIDFSSRILRKQNVLEFMAKIGFNNKERIRNALIGYSVVATYGNYRMWKIDDIDFDSNPGKKFETQAGVETTLIDYYKARYNIKLQDRFQPLLVSSDKRGQIFYIMPELVHLTGLSEEMRCDRKLMQDIANYTRLDPSNRFERTAQINRELKDSLADYSEIRLDSVNPVKGFLLPQPQILLGQDKWIQPSSGIFSMKSPVFQPANIKRWLFIYAGFDESNEDQNGPLKKFLKAMPKCKGGFGIGIDQPSTYPVQDRDPEVFRQKLIEKIEEHNPEIVLAFFPKEQRREWYPVLKEVCLDIKGVPSQALLTSSLIKHPESVCEKVLIQMNAKIGKAPWMTKPPEGLPEKTMVIGADVFHQTNSELKSCIGFCSSTDPLCTKFFSQVKFQKKGEEIMKEIALLVKNAVVAFFKASGYFPECIIFFRDGVAENQLQAILEVETKSILNQLGSIYQTAPIKFAEIIINKRIDDRLFTKVVPASLQGRNPQQYYNPPAGTLASQDIVSDDFEYLLVSQDVKQGTSTPTRYKVIYNSTDLTQDIFWNLTYSQCFNYYNWPGGIRIPGPVKYAHTLAYQIGKTLQKSPNKNLEGTLYFL